MAMTQRNETMLKQVKQYYCSKMKEFVDSKVEAWSQEEMCSAHERVKCDAFSLYLTGFTPDPHYNGGDFYMHLEKQIMVCYDNFIHNNKEKKIEHGLKDVRRVGTVAGTVWSVAGAVNAVGSAMSTVERWVKRL